MRHNHKTFLSLILIFLVCHVTSHAAEIKPLNESIVVEVINEVSILTGESLSAQPAKAEMLFKTPDLLQTGRRSGARLEADDGTITRVGSNTLFSFDESSRSINLKRGSLLFHSPEGIGGGRVVTASATASVLGTTIVVAATPNGGFKLLVLEGTAKVAFSDGTIYILNAGQMTFVLPGESSQKRRTQTNAPGQTGAEVAEGQPGPVLNFDLNRMLRGSFLLRGFSDPIPSQPKIDNEVGRQLSLIKSGVLNSTDSLIINVEDSDTIVLQEMLTGNLETNKRGTNRRETNQESPDPEDPDDNGELDSELARFQRAIQSTIAPQSDGFPTENFFEAPGVFVASDVIEGVDYDPSFFYGFIAGNLHFTGGELDLSPIRVTLDSSPLDYYLLGAINMIEFAGDLSITGFQNSSAIEFSTFGTLDFFANTGGLRVNDTSSNYIGLSLSGDQGITFNTVEIENNSGHIVIVTNQGDLSLNESFLDAGASNLTPPIAIDSFDAVDSANSINLEGNNISIMDSTITATGKIDLLAEDQINLSGSTFNASHIELRADQQIRVNASSLSANFIKITANQILSDGASYNGTEQSDSPGSGTEQSAGGIGSGMELSDSFISSWTELNMEAIDLIDLLDLDLSGLTQVNMGARTLVLADINFSSSANNNLQSENGMLAPNPNTNQSAITGFVNFIRNVTVDMELPAQDFVPVAQGGNHNNNNSDFPPAIQISQIGQVIGSELGAE